MCALSVEMFFENLCVGKRSTGWIMGHTKNGVDALIVAVVTLKHIDVIIVESGLLVITSKLRMIVDIVKIALNIWNLEKRRIDYGCR